MTRRQKTEALEALRALDLASAKLHALVAVGMRREDARLVTIENEVLAAALRYGAAMAACGATVKPRTN